MTDQKLPGKFTIEKLQAMGPAKLLMLWKNAKKSSVEGAAELAEAIELLGILSFMEGGMPLDSPAAIRMEEIINSDEGVAACLEATKRGEPALAGVDQEIKKALGEEYSGQNQGTHTAGWFVGELMRSKGYKIAKRGPMPKGCTAKTAAIWVPRNSLSSLASKRRHEHYK